jgi:flavin reductase (DIM6/NTAB) family NADH-FMN oxidoreductase RutF
MQPGDRLEPEALTEDGYRLLSSYAASGVAIVSTRLRGRDYAATVTAFLSVSYDPPTMLVSLFELSRIAEAVAESGTWALTLLGRGQQPIARRLSSAGAPVEGMFDQIPHGRGPVTDAAIPTGAVAWFEVKTSAVHTAATHQLFVGDVLSMGRFGEREPLLHYGSLYRELR